MQNQQNDVTKDRQKIFLARKRKIGKIGGKY